MPLNISKSRLAAKRSEAASLDFWNVCPQSVLACSSIMTYAIMVLNIAE
jgi:hypothetical protein